MKTSAVSFLVPVVALAICCFLVCGCGPADQKSADPGNTKTVEKPTAKISKEAMDKAFANVEKYEQEYKAKPDSEMAKRNLITAYMRVGTYSQQKNDFGQAITYFKKAHDVDPNDLDPLRYLGRAQFQNGDQEGAMASFRKVLDKQPNDFPANLYLGHILSARGKDEEAVKYYETAISQNYDSKEANKGLMLSYKKLNLTDKAKEIEKRMAEIKVHGWIPDRGHGEKLGKQWREQFEKDKTDFRALYNFAACNFDKVKHYGTKQPSELNIPDIHNIKKGIAGMSLYVKLTKDVPAERPYYEVMKNRKKKIGKLAEKRIHQLKAEYAKAGKPVPAELTSMPGCSDMAALQKLAGISDGGSEE